MNENLLEKIIEAKKSFELSASSLLHKISLNCSLDSNEDTASLVASGKVRAGPFKSEVHLKTKAKSGSGKWTFESYSLEAPGFRLNESIQGPLGPDDIDPLTLISAAILNFVDYPKEGQLFAGGKLKNYRLTRDGKTAHLSVRDKPILSLEFGPETLKLKLISLKLSISLKLKVI